MIDIYTGIGSRKAPQWAILAAIGLGAELAKLGYTLRSGHADGMDLAFEDGCDSEVGKKEIYLPWENFNGSYSSYYDISIEALTLASKIHPAWERCSRQAKCLHARNTYQVLGFNLNKPSDFIICWTPEGKDVGGTRTALILGRQHDIPILNLELNTDRTVENILDAILQYEKTGLWAL